MTIKQITFNIVNDQDEGGTPNHLFDLFIIALIILNVSAIFLESFEVIYSEYHAFFDSFELFSVAIFSIEYVIRIWTCTEYSEFSHPITGRIKYALSIKMLIDLLAVFPFYLALLLPLDPRMVKLLRLFRLFRIFKLLRYYGSIDVICEVIRKNKSYLIAVFAILLIFLVQVSYTVFLFENEAQPDKFSNVADAFWWSVVTLTTVGYGDVYPITEIGKSLTVFILLIGIGIIALPTGIIASGFLEEMRSRNNCAVPVQNDSLADEIRKIHSLKVDGIITDEEFLRLKDKIVK